MSLNPVKVIKSPDTYFETLSGEVKKRYLEKIKIINNCDSSMIKAQELSDNIEELPEISTMDLVNYLILTHSFYTGKQLKAYKSLEAYKFVEAGFVQALKFKKIEGYYVVVGDVKHSQRMNDSNLKVWIIILPDCSISSAHCTCVAGLGEVCSHSAAILFALNSRCLAKEVTESCTDKLALWPIPKVSKKVKPSKVSEMNWGRRFQQRDEAAHGPALEGATLLNFLTKFEEVKPSAAILSVIEPFASKRTTADQSNVPISLLNFHSSSFEGFSLEDLRSVELDLSITREEQLSIERLTRYQSKSDTWYKFKSKRISGTTFELACNTSIGKPSNSLIKGVCYPTRMLFEPAQIKYGKTHESISRRAYANYMKEKNHTNLKVEETGFIVSLIHPQLGASPDGIVTCDCCESGCLEIKCPFLLKDGTKSISEFADMKSTCLLKDENRCSLNKNHTYYY